MGNFSAYQLTTASMSRFFLREPLTELLRPKQDILIEGKPGLLLHYYPLDSLLAAVLSAFTHLPLEFTGRLQAVLFSLGTVFLLYALGAQVRDAAFGLLVAAMYAISPVSVIYGQSFMNEAMGVFWVVLGLYAFVRYSQQSAIGWFFAATIAVNLAIVTRLNGFYVFLPLLVLCVWGKEGLRVQKVWLWVSFCAISLLLPLAWYGYTYFMARTNPHVYICMFPQIARQAPHTGSNMAFVKALLRITATLDFTPLGLVLLVLGLARGGGWGKEDLWIQGWFLGVLASFFLMSQKIADHNFYSLHLVSPAAFFIADGFLWVGKRFGKWAAVFAATLVFLSSARYFYHPVVKTILEENHGVLQAAQAVREKVPADAKIIAASGSSDNLLYYCDRHGWDFMVTPPAEIPYQMYFRWRFLPPEETQRRSKAFLDPIAWLEFLRGEGASYFAATRPELAKNEGFLRYLQTHYPHVSSDNDPFWIFDLAKKGNDVRAGPNVAS